jgi:hypothetical protein
MGTSYIGLDFDDIVPGTVDTFGFKLARWLASGEVLQSGVFSLAVKDVAPGFPRDTNPQSHVSGAAFLALDSNGLATVISQVLSGLLAGNRYVVSCIALTTFSNQKTPWSYVTCRPPA